MSWLERFTSSAGKQPTIAELQDKLDSAAASIAELEAERTDIKSKIPLLAKVSGSRELLRLGAIARELEALADSRAAFRTAIDEAQTEEAAAEQERKWTQLEAIKRRLDEVTEDAQKGAEQFAERLQRVHAVSEEFRTAAAGLAPRDWEPLKLAGELGLWATIALYVCSATPTGVVLKGAISEGPGVLKQARRSSLPEFVGEWTGTALRERNRQRLGSVTENENADTV